MPGPLAKVRLLMCGRDEALLDTRARVLETIGCRTNLAYSLDQMRAELTAADKPRLVLICHTAGTETAGQVRSLALQAGVPTYFIEKLLPPGQLLSDVSTLIQESEPSARMTAARRSV